MAGLKDSWSAEKTAEQMAVYLVVVMVADWDGCLADI